VTFRKCPNFIGGFGNVGHSLLSSTDENIGRVNEGICEDRRHSINDVLRLLKEDVERKHPDRCRTLDWLLHHDDALSLTAWSVKQFLIENNWTAVPHPALIPELAPCVS
jgi:hypothetical protein